MSQCKEILSKAAKEGVCDSSKWPAIFSDVLQRLEHNIYGVFALPKIRPPANAPPLSSDAIPISTAQTESSGPPPPSSPPRPQTPSQPLPLSSDQSANAPSVSPPSKTLPPPLSATYNFVKDSLRENFSQQPPHTLQRFAELILYPTEHHKFLFSYLNALDRVVCVSSTNDVFPLPDTDRPNGITTNGPLVNGTAPALQTPSTSFGGDDTLGGALLTPIPWLRRASMTAEDDNERASPSPVMSPLSQRSVQSASSEDISPSSPEQTSPSREAGAVTQGELLRAEQQANAPPAPVTSLSTSATIGRSASPSGDEEEVPHARGPEDIGMEDTGPQTAHDKDKPLDLEAAIGRKHHSHGHDGTDDHHETLDKDEAMEDADQDAVVADVDGRTDEDKDMKDEGEEPAALGRDTTAG